ncbi:hypothetical protein [Stutzerimonas degradans]|uniref:Uncharacterized protein n=1 Tax=Stutzerimonas degradans TaxID=2968968 RepID=A0A8E2QFV5_9GAMM|nr:hypothetical protein [Stutzerimonas degradans]MCQ4274501.1 hypothetical protein [Stutzerimonas degradans]PNF77932.1 hypothetical protein CXK95_01155 [Stutzerimonas degradans]QPT23327.1 hypothetical protein I6G33_08765 [Stutzerimonas degradans]
MRPAIIDLHIVQGSTLRDTLRLMQPRYEYRPITGISGSPLRLTVDHGLPGSWLAWVEGVNGMQGVNRSTRESPHRVTVVDAATLEINALSAFCLSPSGGQLIYKPPVDLTGATARMQIRAQLGGAVLLELTTENGALAITGLGTITRTLSAAQTAALTWTDGVYDLEVQFPDGTVQRYLQGAVTVSREVTV